MLQVLVIYFLFLFVVPSYPQPNKPYLLNTIKKYSTADTETYEKIVNAANTIDYDVTQEYYFFNYHSPLLFSFYPALNTHIAYISLGNFPTPVEHLTTLEEMLPVKELWIKRDDLTGVDESVGGNKVRKLEFLLADAIKNGATTVLTFGCVASNHALAAAFYTHILKLQCILMLKPQPNSYVVRNNLLHMFFYNAQMNWSPTLQKRSSDTIEAIITCIKDNTIPYVIPTGGSCPLGILGYVNAVFELKQQIDQGLCPEPDYIFVPAGSKGTAVGLLLGLKACNLKSKLVAITTENEGKPGYFKNRMKELFQAANTYLADNDSSFPVYDFDDNQIEVVLTSAGKAYGLFTQEGHDAKVLMDDTQNIILDGTYTAKAFAGLLEYLKDHNLSQSTVLYWHTYDNHSDPTAVVTDYHNLPTDFHQYFQKDVQPLDHL